MNGGRSFAALVAAVVLATASACTSLLPRPGAAAVADCTAVSRSAMMNKLREIGSYAYTARGVVTSYGSSIGAADVPSDIEMRGTYVAPDGLNVTFEGAAKRHDALRILGAEQWVRGHGSLRWEPMARDNDRPPNALLEELADIPDWSGADADAEPGSCTLTGSGTYVDEGQTVTATAVVTTPLGSAMPRAVAIDFRYPNPHPRSGATSSRSLTYEIEPGTGATIERPVVDASAATEDDLRYAVRHLACEEAPCSIENLRVAYAFHQPGLDLIGYEAGGRAGEAWFDHGRVQHVVARGCAAPAFAWHEHDGGESGTWLGGPMTLADSAILRVRYSDGAVEEHEVSAPAYIVPNREHVDDGASIVEVGLFTADGTDLLGEARSAHGGHTARC